MPNQNESTVPTSKERKIAAFKESHRGRISRGSRTRVISEPELPRPAQKVSQHKARIGKTAFIGKSNLADKVVHDVGDEQHETEGRRNARLENNSRYGRREHHGNGKS